MKKLFLKITLFAGLFIAAGTISSCSKSDDDNNVVTSSNKDYFMNNAVDQNFAALLASDNGADITAKFNGYTFRLAKSASLSGTATVMNDLLSVNGTWTVDANYDKITFVFPTSTIPDLAFVNQEWQFASRSSTTIDLVSTSGENDKLQLARK